MACMTTKCFTCTKIRWQWDAGLKNFVIKK